jgi:hypothetical protein
LLNGPNYLRILKMAGVKGRSGTNKGKDKDFAEAVRVAVNRTHDGDKEGRKKLFVLADKLVDFAMAGEGWAMQQIADRLDGKPAQESTVTIDDKRDATDWTRDELVAFLRDAAADRAGTPEKEGRGRKPDRVH